MSEQQAKKQKTDQEGGIQASVSLDNDDVTAHQDCKPPAQTKTQADGAGGEAGAGPEVLSFVKLLGFESVAGFKDKLGEIDNVKRETSELKGRLDKIAGTFEPATSYALMETAVHGMIEDTIGGGDNDKMKFAVATVCSNLLKFLETQDEMALKNDNGGFKNWRGPGKKKNNDD